MSETLSNILDYNKEFVRTKQYLELSSTKYPDKNLAILGCMDTRLTELLPKALGIKNGDAKLIKNAGGVVLHPWDSVMSSLLIAVYELQVNEILVIGHLDCGLEGMNAQKILTKALDEGIKPETIELLQNIGINLDNWLKGFDSVEDSVRHTTSVIKKHPLMPKRITVHGLVIDPGTGQLNVVVQDK